VSDLQRSLRDKQGDIRTAATDLWHLFGKKTVVRKDGDPEPTIVSYRENLPDDLAPLVILDASGRVAATYSWWETHRRGLTRLKPGRKHYGNLTLHVWRIGAAHRASQ